MTAPADLPTATLTCPKCRGQMVTYERNRVMVDQCQDCRGIFLDRGELEHLIDAEQGFSTAAPAAAPAPATPAYGGAQRREEYGSGPYREQHAGDYRRRKKRSFLEDLFD